MDDTSQDQRRAYSFWLRTGLRPVARLPDGIELKFNPYHDPRNGRFTFAPGGPTMSGGYVRRLAAKPGKSVPPLSGDVSDQSILGDDPVALLSEANQTRPPVRRGTTPGRGNIERFYDPMTLERVFPGLSNSPGGALLAVADNLLDIRGPANESQIELIDNWSRQIINQIKSVDPNWRYDRLGPVTSVDGRMNELNDLRFQRAAVFFRAKGDLGPLQVATLRFVQQRTDAMYDQARILLEAGRLTPRLSAREAVGNYIDKEVRRSLRERYNQLGIDSAGKGPVRVNRRENDSSATDATYRRPDARIGTAAFDVTLTRKTLATAQVRGFFNADFRPDRVVIIRPRQLGTDATYVISRPGTK